MSVPLWLEITALAIASITGSLASSRVKMDLLGVIICGCIVAIGGGTLRDCMMGLPAFWTQNADAKYLVTPIIAAILTFFYVRKWAVPTGTLRIADALVVALFNAMGCNKALEYGMSMPVAIFMGVCTGCAGGVVRDVLTGNVPFILRHGEFYATCAILGGIAYCATYEIPNHGTLPLWSCIAVNFLTRLAAIRWTWTLPSYRPLYEAMKDAETAQKESSESQGNNQNQG